VGVGRQTGGGETRGGGSGLRPWAVEVGGRWRGSMATRGERSDKATTHV
jgi:hypothetical protein